MTSQPSLLTEAEQSVLVIIDVQKKLARAMPEGSLERIRLALDKLLRGAALLNVPVLVTEQYPQGLGKTLDPVRESLPSGTEVVEKNCFAATGCGQFMELLTLSGRRQLILTGMEAHVCVLQTAVELYREGYEVFVVQDAISSRSQSNADAAVARMRDAGVRITVSESVLFEWLRGSGHEHFKAVSALLR